MAKFFSPLDPPGISLVKTKHFLHQRPRRRFCLLVTKKKNYLLTSEAKTSLCEIEYKSNKI